MHASCSLRPSCLHRSAGNTARAARVVGHAGPCSHAARIAGATCSTIRLTNSTCSIPPAVSSPPARRVSTAASSSSREPVFDPAGYVKYAGAIPAQVGIMTGALWVLQQLTDSLSSGALPVPGGVADPADVAKGIVTLFFLVVSIKSRVFSLLDASRPNVRGEKSAIAEQRRPSWMPPPLTFPIVWTSIGLLRAASSVIVWEASGRDLLVTPIVVMMLHLAIGDAWNHCNNVDRNLGMAVPGVILGCLGSGIFVASAYYIAEPTAGLLLAPMVVWLTIASALVASIWDINPGEDGERMPLVPVKKEA